MVNPGFMILISVFTTIVGALYSTSGACKKLLVFLDNIISILSTMFYNSYRLVQHHNVLRMKYFPRDFCRGGAGGRGLYGCCLMKTAFK